MVDSVKAKCKYCDKELDPSHTGPCPSCGKTGKEVILIVNDKVGLKASVSEERKVKLYLDWFKRKFSLTWVAKAIAIVFNMVVIITASQFVGLAEALIILVYSIILSYLAISLGVEMIKGKARNIVLMNLAADVFKLWNSAVGKAKSSPVLKRMNEYSKCIFILALGLGLLFYFIDLWTLDNLLDYLAITFIAWGAIVHLSDRLYMREDDAIAICRNLSWSSSSPPPRMQMAWQFQSNADKVNASLLTELVIKKKLGKLSAAFVLAGMLSEFVKLGIEIVSHILK